MIRLELDSHERLVATLSDGKRHVDVVPVRAFPLSAPQEFIGLLDARGREVACIATIDELDEGSREILEKTLKSHEFMPIIHDVLEASPGAPPTTFRALTDRGEVTFLVTSEEHIRNLEGGGLLITDAHGIRYRVPDTSQLSRQSRKLLGLLV